MYILLLLLIIIVIVGVLIYFQTTPTSIFKMCFKIYEKAKINFPNASEEELLYMVLSTKPPFDIFSNKQLHQILVENRSIEQLTDFITSHYKDEELMALRTKMPYHINNKIEKLKEYKEKYILHKKTNKRKEKKIIMKNLNKNDKLKFINKTQKLIDGGKAFIYKSFMEQANEYFDYLNKNESPSIIAAIVNEVFFDKQSGNAAIYKKNNNNVLKEQVELCSKIPQFSEIISYTLMLKAFIEKDKSLKTKIIKKAREMNPSQKELTYHEIRKLFKDSSI